MFVLIFIIGIKKSVPRIRLSLLSVSLMSEIYYVLYTQKELNNGRRCTCTTHRSDAVLVDREAIFERPCAHVFVEHIASGEVEEGAVILIIWDQTDVNAAVRALVSSFVQTRQATYTLRKKKKESWGQTL